MKNVTEILVECPVCFGNGYEEGGAILSGDSVFDYQHERCDKCDGRKEIDLFDEFGSELNDAIDIINEILETMDGMEIEDSKDIIQKLIFGKND